MKRITLLSIIIIFLSGLLFLSSTNSSGATAGTARSNADQELEQHILNATVRFMVESWIVRPDETGYDIDYTMGHGTVMNGRFLVTHNHFDVPLSILNREGDAGSYVVIYLYNSQGEPLLKVPFADFELAGQDVETLVFAHKEEGFFTNLGLSSAAFADGAAQALQPGTEVAQVDWDGMTARVDWVTVQEVILDEGPPRLILADAVLPGASGGGIFYHGVHVANNWHLHEKIDATGAVVEAVTAVALNSAIVVN